MNTDGLAKTLTDLRDEAHRLSKEKLASDAPNAARLTRAQELDGQLQGLVARIEAAPAAERAQHNDVAQVARRYLIFLLLEAAGTPATPRDRAQSLHNDMVEAGRAIAAGKLEEPERTRRAAEFTSCFNELRAEPGRDDPEVQRILGDVHLDLEFIRQGGQAPSSLRLGREVRG